MPLATGSDHMRAKILSQHLKGMVVFWAEKKKKASFAIFLKPLWSKHLNKQITIVCLLTITFLPPTNKGPEWTGLVIFTLDFRLVPFRVGLQVIVVLSPSILRKYLDLPFHFLPGAGEPRGLTLQI